MKKVILLLAVAALLLSTACGNAETPANVSFDEAALQEDAEQVADDLQNGNYAAVAEKFNKKMADAVSPEALGDGWEQTVAAMGAYLERVSATGSVQEGYYVVDIVESFENSGVNVHVVYDGEGKIAGLRCTYADISAVEQSDAYTETDITVLRGEFSDLSDETMLMGIPVGYWKSLKQYGGENFIEDISMPKTEHYR